MYLPCGDGAKQHEVVFGRPRTDQNGVFLRSAPLWASSPHQETQSKFKHARQESMLQSERGLCKIQGRTELHRPPMISPKLAQKVGLVVLADSETLMQPLHLVLHS